MSDKLSGRVEKRITERFPEIFEDLKSGMLIGDICRKHGLQNNELIKYWKRHHHITPKKHQKALLDLKEKERDKRPVDFTPYLDGIISDYREGNIPEIVAKKSHEWKRWTKEMLEACSNGYLRGYAQGPLGYVFENLFVTEFRDQFDKGDVRGFFKKLRNRKALTSKDMKLGIKVQQYFQNLGDIYPQGTGPYEFGELVYVSESGINHEDQVGKWARPTMSLS